MPKLKTKRAAAKRFRVKSNGSIKRGQANSQHILTKMDRNHKNRLKKRSTVHDSDLVLVRRCLPHG